MQTLLSGDTADAAKFTPTLTRPEGSTMLPPGTASLVNLEE
jgi:hypothetical protein